MPNNEDLSQYPLGSNAFPVFDKNVQNLDVAVNSEADSWPDRFGKNRKTWAGMENDFQQFLIDSGYVNIGDYGPGLEITARNQIFWRDGELYRAGAVLELPYTTTGDWQDEDNLFVAVGDAALRQQLADGVSRTGGASLVSRATPQIVSFDELRTVSGRYAGDQIDLLGHTRAGVGAGRFRWDPGATQDDDGGNVAQAPGGRWIRITNAYAIDDFGADPTGQISSSPALAALLAAYPDHVVGEEDRWKPVIKLGCGRYVFDVGDMLISYSQGVFLNIQGEGVNATQVVYTGEEQYFLDFPSEFIELSNFQAQSTSPGKRFLKQRLPDGHADIDCLFQNVFSLGWEYMHHCYGRGSRNIDCTMAEGTWTLIESPDPFTEGVASIQKQQTGMRRYLSENLMVDGGEAIFELSENGPAAEYINDISVLGLTGNSLNSIIVGGYINLLTIKTGVLTNSFQPGAVRCRRVRKMNMDITAVRGYNDSVAPSPQTSIPYLISLNPLNQNDMSLDDTKISGLVGNLSEGLIRTTGKIGNVNILNLVCPNAFEYMSSQNSVFVSAEGGIDENSKLTIDNISFSGSLFAGTGFFWAAPSEIPSENLVIGKHTSSNVPTKLMTKNFGIASILAGQTSVSFPHGLSSSPSSRSVIQVTPISEASAGGGFYISDITNTHVTITKLASADTDAIYSWRVDRSQS